MQILKSGRIHFIFWKWIMKSYWRSKINSITFMLWPTCKKVYSSCKVIAFRDLQRQVIGKSLSHIKFSLWNYYFVRIVYLSFSKWGQKVVTVVYFILRLFELNFFIIWHLAFTNRKDFDYFGKFAKILTFFAEVITITK